MNSVAEFDGSGRMLKERMSAMSLEMDLPASCRLRVSLYGPMEVWKRDDAGVWQLVEKEAWGKGRAARSVFKRLLVAPGRRLSRATIQDDLWPHSEHFDLMDRTIYNAINQIRHVTGKTLLKTLETSYEVADQSMIWIDRDACNHLLKEIENQGHLSVQALPLLEQACEYLERGELLEGEEGTWVYGVRKKSEDLLRQVQLWLAENYERQGKLWQAGEQYYVLCQIMPPDEDALCSWIEMLCRQGKIQQAIKVYQDTQTNAEQQGYALSPKSAVLARELQEQADFTRPSPAQPLQAIIPREETILEEADFMDRTRREISLQCAKIAFGLATFPTFPIDALGKRLLVALQHYSPDGKSVQYLHQRIEHYWEQRQTAKLGPVLIPYASEDLQRVLTLLEGPLLPHIRIELTVIIGNLAMLLGELFFELNLYREARDYYNIAAIAAHEADNPVLEAVIYGRRSLTWTYQSQLDEALSCIQKGRALAEHSAHVTTWLAAMEAEIQAKRGNSVACFASLKDASNLRNLPDQQPFYWIHFDLSLLAGYEGACFLRLKKPLKARQALVQAIEMLDTITARRKPRLLIDLAQTYVQQGDIEAACTTSLQATDLLRSIKSPVTQGRLLSLRNELAPWQQNVAVHRLDEAIYQLTEMRE
jgi:DNA-binding SARP family transcriptional activator